LALASPLDGGVDEDPSVGVEGGGGLGGVHVERHGGGPDLGVRAGGG